MLNRIKENCLDTLKPNGMFYSIHLVKLFFGKRKLNTIIYSDIK